MSRYVASQFTSNTSGPRAWIGVVSLAHVERGVAGGFAQVCHGKQGPLMRMQPGDWFIYYSPATEMRVGLPLRAFTAIGKVCERAVYRFDAGDGLSFFRRDIDYFVAKQAPLQSVASALHFTRAGSNWGMLARRGHFEIDTHDCQLIAHAMGVADLRLVKAGTKSPKNDAR